jgi:hypothetical protein
MVALTWIARIPQHALDCVVGVCVTWCDLEWADLPCRKVILEQEGCKCVLSLY